MHLNQRSQVKQQQAALAKTELFVYLSEEASQLCLSLNGPALTLCLLFFHEVMFTGQPGLGPWDAGRLPPLVRKSVTGLVQGLGKATFPWTSALGCLRPKNQS